MPTATYDLIASTTLSSTSNSVTFSSLPSTYRDIVLVAQFSANTTTNAGIRFNGDESTSNYMALIAAANGSSAASGVRADNGTIQGEGTVLFSVPSSGSQAVYIAHILDYSATDKHKLVLIRADQASQGTAATVGRWFNTAAINQITIHRTGNITGQTFNSGSRFFLYGIVS